MSNKLNIEQITAVAVQLQELKDKVVFVGGSTTALLVDDVAAGSARQTEDVDFIVDISVESNYQSFERRMCELGFVNDQSMGAPICRWTMPFMGGKLKVDSMPIDEEILGFSNRWYRESMDFAWEKVLNSDLTINVIDPVYFLGTKFEAYSRRGENNIFSHDLEDVFFVIEHRSDIDILVYESKAQIKSYLSECFTLLINHPDYENTLPGMLDNSSAWKVVRDRVLFIATKCV